MLRSIRFDIFFVGFFFGRATRNLMKLDSNFQRWSILLQNKILSVLVPVVAATLASELRKHLKHFKKSSSAAISLLVFSSFSIQAWPQNRSQLFVLHGLGGQACIDRQLESKWTTFRSAVDTDTTRSRLINAERCWKLWFCLFWDSVEE